MWKERPKREEDKDKDKSNKTNRGKKRQIKRTIVRENYTKYSSSLQERQEVIPWDMEREKDRIN